LHNIHDIPPHFRVFVFEKFADEIGINSSSCFPGMGNNSASDLNSILYRFIDAIE